MMGRINNFFPKTGVSFKTVPRIWSCCKHVALRNRSSNGQSVAKASRASMPSLSRVPCLSRNRQTRVSRGQAGPNDVRDSRSSLVASLTIKCP